MNSLRRWFNYAYGIVIQPDNILNKMNMPSLKTAIFKTIKNVVKKLILHNVSRQVFPIVVEMV